MTRPDWTRDPSWQALVVIGVLVWIAYRCGAAVLLIDFIPIGLGS